MKKVTLLIGVLLFLPLISSQIIITQQPETVYNLGEVVTVATTLKYTTSVAGIFQMNLICDGVEENFYKNGVSISPGEEKKIEASLVLTKDIIGDMKGDCVIKSFLLGEQALTNHFRISDSITMQITFENTEFSPGEVIEISGDATKENGEPVNGFVEMAIIENNGPILTQTDVINSGSFTVRLTLPEDMKAGAYLVRLSAHEKDLSEQITNYGTMNQNIAVKQIPTTLEVILEEDTLDPGATLRVKAILHDQSGEQIVTSTFLSIKSQNNKILDQVEVPTDQFYSYTLAQGELPATWKVVAASNKLTSEKTFTIVPKEAIDIQITNRTIIITNVGNVLYDKEAFVKVGDQSITLDVLLDVGESQKYIITAPDGSYNVEVLTGDERAFADQVSLTGRAVDVKKAPGRAGSLLRYPFFWIFIVLVLGLGLFVFVKRSARRDFFAYIVSKFSRKHHSHETHHPHTHPHHSHTHHAHAHHHAHQEHHHDFLPLTKGSLLKSERKAEIALSIKGEKQDVSLVTINIKGLKGAQSKEGGTVETLQKIVNLAESRRAATYEDNNSLIFILSPLTTKTYKNERTALEIAQHAKDALTYHNKIFKPKLDYGISLNFGPLILKHEQHSLKFSSIGPTMSLAKKVASVANEEVLLSDHINEKLRAEVKTIKHHKSGTDVYAIKEVKNFHENAKFIKSFSDRYQKEHGHSKK